MVYYTDTKSAQEEKMDNLLDKGFPFQVEFYLIQCVEGCGGNKNYS